jgi:hypothetical protein
MTSQRPALVTFFLNYNPGNNHVTLIMIYSNAKLINLNLSLLNFNDDFAKIKIRDSARPQGLIITVQSRTVRHHCTTNVPYEVILF